MKNINLKFKILITFTFFFFGIFGLEKSSEAADVTAASCSAADIQTAINNCVSTGGGTVHIPSCNQTWASTDRVCVASNAELHLKGAGVDSTVITRSAGPCSYSNNCPAGFSNDVPDMMSVRGTGIKEISDFTLDMGSVACEGAIRWYQCTSSACTSGVSNARLHHMKFRNTPNNSSRGAIYICQNFNTTTLIDHIQIGPNTYSTAYGLTIAGGVPESSFEVPPAVGTNNGLFVEDSIFKGNYHPIASFMAARLTARHNIFNGNTAGLEGHGTPQDIGCGYGAPSQYNGSYRYEIYDNQWINRGGVDAMLPRSGFWIITGNTMDSASGYINEIAVDEGSVTKGGGGGARTQCQNTSYGCPWTATGYTTSDSCYQTPRIYFWNNNYTASPWLTDTRGWCTRVGTEILQRAPQVGDPYITSWSRYTYPHPLQGAGTPDTTPPAAPTGVSVQ